MTLPEQAGKFYLIGPGLRKVRERRLDHVFKLESSFVEPRETSERLSRWAVEAGFDRAAVARLRPAANRAFYLDWLARGLHAGMGYLARRVEARLDPGKLFPRARSALCVALQYHGGESGGEAVGDLWSGVARYARGADYHDTMGRRLAGLARRIEAELPGTVTRWYVDTGPVLERELASSAGLGAIGKNTCLLHPDAGSWFLLGEVFTSLDLPASGVPLADLCGSCSRCLEACPTGALPRPFELDSRRCISYWTIEHRGEIPREIRPLIGEWVFGCDLCQEVCPHNDRPTLPVDEAFQLPDERGELTLEGLLELDAEGYREIFRGSPMKRAKLAGLKRNAIVALGNRGKAESVEVLLRVLREGDAELRLHAAWALGRLGTEAARGGLESAAPRDPDARVRDEIARALGRSERSS